MHILGFDRASSIAWQFDAIITSCTCKSTKLCITQMIQRNSAIILFLEHVKASQAWNKNDPAWSLTTQAPPQCSLWFLQFPLTLHFIVAWIDFYHLLSQTRPGYMLSIWIIATSLLLSIASPLQRLFGPLCLPIVIYLRRKSSSHSSKYFTISKEHIHEWFLQFFCFPGSINMPILWKFPFLIEILFDCFLLAHVKR